MTTSALARYRLIDGVTPCQRCTPLIDHCVCTQVAVLLDSIPVFNILFFYTNIIGSGALAVLLFRFASRDDGNVLRSWLTRTDASLAALWAIDMEKAQTLENSFLLPANALIDDVGIIDTEELH